MRCPNCRCEIGNLKSCPYCGMVLYSAPPTNQAYTRPASRRPATTPAARPSVSNLERRKERHLANLDTWGLLCVVLLGGIFVLQLLQFVQQLL